jgi:hypothetical protein
VHANSSCCSSYSIHPAVGSSSQAQARFKLHGAASDIQVHHILDQASSMPHRLCVITLQANACIRQLCITTPSTMSCRILLLLTALLVGCIGSRRTELSCQRIGTIKSGLQKNSSGSIYSIKTQPFLSKIPS